MRVRTLLVASLLTVASLAPAAEAQRACRFGSCVLAVFPAVGPIVVEGGAQGVFLLSMLSGVPAPELPLRPLAAPLDAEQQALLGCGPYWGTACERSGIDLRNADAGALLQGWVVPGARGFEGGTLIQVPGGLSPFLPDGVVTDPRFVPIQTGSMGQPFPSEMAALSYNFLTLLVALSSGSTGTPGSDPGAFDPRNPHALFDPGDLSTWSFAGQCSFAQPLNCSMIRALFEVRPPAYGLCPFGRPQDCPVFPALFEPTPCWARSPRRDLAGSNGFGRRAFVWDGFGRQGAARGVKGCLPTRSAAASRRSRNGALPR